MNKHMFLGICAAAAFFPSLADAACANLTSNLSQKSTGASVLVLQNFLKDSGYLFATPNGYFGPSTFAAVKSYQSANKIETTGFVGPTTRAMIQSQSCTTPVPTPSQPTTPAVTKPAASVTLPEEGQALTIGKSYPIHWQTEIRGSYDIILEDESGVAKGYIASSLWGGKTHEWKAGSITSAASSDKLAPAGNYRIRVRSNSDAPDQISGTFQLAGPSLRISSIMPQSIGNGGESVLLYGRGFTNSTSVYIDGIRNISTSRQYVSPDGKFFIFSIPEALSAGIHVISIRNTYGEIANAGTITVE